VETDEGSRGRIVVFPLRGKRRIVARTGEDTGQHHDYQGPTWSPDSRWIAYLDIEDNDAKLGLYLVRPNGRQLHRLVRGEVLTMAWSPDGKKLAFTRANGQLGVVGVAGRGLRRVPLDASASLAEWSPDGRRLAVEASAGGPSQIYVMGEDGRDVQRVTAQGQNLLTGWTRRAPARPPAPAIPPSERVIDVRTVATATPVGALSADGPSVAFVPRGRASDCEHSAVWAPGETSVTRFVLPAPCRLEAARVRDIALAGSRVAWSSSWLENVGECSVALTTSTLASLQSLRLHGAGPNGAGCVPDYYHARGDGELFVFNDGSRIVRIDGGRETCQASSSSGTRFCSAVRRNQAGSVDSVSGALIAVRRPGVVTVLDDRGQVVRTLPFTPADVRAARLDGGRLVVWRFSVLEVYDVAIGARVGSHPVPAGFRLRDVDGGVAVLVSGEAITLLRLADGASRTFSPGRAPVLAELEPDGLYYSYATADGDGRVAFLPREEADPARRLG
jgi:dipeptidyl aminopeptidase/acylaminoacyl peptidase